MSNLYTSVEQAVKQYISGGTMQAKGVKTIAHFALSSGDIRTRAELEVMGLNPSVAEKMSASSNTLKCINEHLAPSDAIQIADWLIESKYLSDLQVCTRFLTQCIGGLDCKASDVFSGKADTRKVIDTAKRITVADCEATEKALYDAEQAKIAEANKAKIAVKAIALVGEPSESEPKGNAEPSPEQKATPRAKFHLALVALSESMESAGYDIEQDLIDKKKAELSKVLAWFDKHMK